MGYNSLVSEPATLGDSSSSEDLRKLIEENRQRIEAQNQSINEVRQTTSDLRSAMAAMDASIQLLLRRQEDNGLRAPPTGSYNPPAEHHHHHPPPPPAHNLREYSVSPAMEKSEIGDLPSPKSEGYPANPSSTHLEKGLQATPPSLAALSLPPPTPPNIRELPVSENLPKLPKSYGEATSKLKPSSAVAAQRHMFVETQKCYRFRPLLHVVHRSQRLQLDGLEAGSGYKNSRQPPLTHCDCCPSTNRQQPKPRNFDFEVEIVALAAAVRFRPGDFKQKVPISFSTIQWGFSSSASPLPSESQRGTISNQIWGKILKRHLFYVKICGSLRLKGLQGDEQQQRCSETGNESSLFREATNQSTNVGISAWVYASRDQIFGRMIESVKLIFWERQNFFFWWVCFSVDAYSSCAKVNCQIAEGWFPCLDSREIKFVWVVNLKLKLGWKVFVSKTKASGVPPNYELHKTIVGISAWLGCSAAAHSTSESIRCPLENVKLFNFSIEETSVQVPYFFVLYVMLKFFWGRVYLVVDEHSGMGKVSTHDILYAQLIIDGQEHGVNGFLVQSSLPGSTICDMGMQFGYGASNTLDNGILRVDHMRIPREQMLMCVLQATQAGQCVQSHVLKQLIYGNHSGDIQFSVQHEQQLECGGGYLQLLSSIMDQIPDNSGYLTKVHVILTRDGMHHLQHQVFNCSPDDLLTKSLSKTNINVPESPNFPFQLVLESLLPFYSCPEGGLAGTICWECLLGVEIMPLFFLWMHADDAKTVILVLERVSIIELTWIMQTQYVKRLGDESLPVCKWLEGVQFQGAGFSHGAASELGSIPAQARTRKIVKLMGLSTGQIQTRAPCRSERLAKDNQHRPKVLWAVI